MLLQIRNDNYRIIVADVKNELIERVLCLAYKNKMTAKESFVWFFPDWVAKSRWHKKMQSNNTTRFACDPNNIDAALNGSFAMSQQSFANASSFHELSKMIEQKPKNASNPIMAPSYLGFVYDAVFSLVNALDDCNCTLDLHYSNRNIATLARAMEKTTFKGHSGLFRMVNGSRITNKLLLQWVNNMWRNVSIFEPDTFSWEFGYVPDDGSSVIWWTNFYNALYMCIGMIAAVAITLFTTIRWFKPERDLSKKVYN